ncbi:LysE family translocator [Helicobacter canis]|uniref:LysE family translocator n=1 Tax=Helicobacter canis TaxID=29419 RepID=UPI001478B0ED|nr:LysE family translocator [Helicobacter canis]
MAVSDISFGNLYIAVFVIGYVGAITPGPDILLILRNTITFGARSAFIALSGIACGWVVFLSLVYFGFAYMMSQPIAQGLLSIFGAIYLGYISYKILRASSPSDLTQILGANTQAKPAGFFQALGVNLSNPKAILFFVVVVAPFANQGFELGLFVLFCSLVSGFVSVILVGLYVRKWLNACVFLWIDRISAVLFIGFACSLGYRGVDIFLH